MSGGRFKLRPAMALGGIILTDDDDGCSAALADAARARGLKVLYCSAREKLDLSGTGLSPAECVAVASTSDAARWCRSTGLVCLGIVSDDAPGGKTEERLRSAGARAVYHGGRDLLQRLDAALRIASPGALRLTSAAMESLMRQALEAARAGMEAAEAPIGCVLAAGDGSVIARAHNRQNATQNKTAHAEIVCFAEAAGKVPLDANHLIMVSTLEPCVMCTGAAMEAAVDTILYALPAPADAGSQRVACPTSPESQMPRIVGGIREQESRGLFEEFLRRHPSPQQRRFVEQLLALA